MEKCSFTTNTLTLLDSHLRLSTYQESLINNFVVDGVYFFFCLQFDIPFHFITVVFTRTHFVDQC